uniref:Uncharacterized protein n=1 Tax=Rhizophora mucronata TaxID=61149 RepID=A0A2P2Q2A3_RHIMU
MLCIFAKPIIWYLNFYSIPDFIPHISNSLFYPQLSFKVLKWSLTVKIF